MEKQDENFWEHLALWQKIPKVEKSVQWKYNWLENDWCGDCRYCCGPQGDDAPFPMPLLPSQIGPDNTKDFFMLDRTTPCIGAQGCKSASTSGCKLPPERKPPACSLFPLVLANGRLYLYKMCPAVLNRPLKEFLEIGKQAARYLSNYDRKTLETLSIKLSPEILASKYIDLHLPLLPLAEKGLEGNRKS